MSTCDDDPRIRTYLRKISRGAFKYAAPLGTLFGVVYCAGYFFGKTEFLVIELLCSTGIIAFILLILASHACRFCRLHRIFLAYDLMISLIAKQDNVSAWLYAAMGAVGVILLVEMCVRLWLIHAKKMKRCD